MTIRPRNYMERAYLVQSLKRYSTKRTERTKIVKVHLAIARANRSVV